MENLYIHVPFCQKKCDYCAFYSIENSSRDLQERWLEKLKVDLEKNTHRLQQVKTLYFGGGTPTIPDPDLLEKIFRTVLAEIHLMPGAEITSEANPETITAERADILGKYVNRISMGVQSFREEKRKVLGRHPVSAEKIFPAMKNLRNAGLKNIGIDLMYAVPGETLAQWEDDLKQAVDLGVEHLSAYALTPEENTPYAIAHGLKAADDNLASDMWHTAANILAKGGMERYEISNYAKKDHEAEHNCNVWSGGTYLGLGPSATSFDGTDRWTEQADLTAWLNGAPPEWDRISRAARLREIFIMGLRTVNGWKKETFSAATGCDIWCDAEAERILKNLQGQGLIRFDTAKCCPTKTGLEFWNTIAEQLIL